MNDEELTGDFSGALVNASRLSAEGWQNTVPGDLSNFIARKERRWMKELTPAQSCGCHKVRPFVLLQLGKDNTVESIGTVVLGVDGDSIFDLEVPMECGDHANARAACNAIIDPSTVKAQPKTQLNGASIERLATLVGVSESSGEMKKLVASFSLRRSQVFDILEGESHVYSSADKVIEITADASGHIARIRLSCDDIENRTDMLEKKLPFTASRDDALRVFGSPLRKGEDWDTFDRDTTKLTLGYGPGGKGISVVVAEKR